MNDFKEISNPWSVYVLPDGRQCRVRHVLSEVVQTGADAEGVAIYDLKFATVVVVEPTVAAPVSLEKHRIFPEHALKKTDIQ